MLEGSRSQVATGADGLGTAVFDLRRRYRYRLSRIWDPDLPRLAWCMLNPSTADASSTDPTLRRVVRFTQAWGYGAVEAVNLFAWRTKDPDRLVSVGDPVGPHNDEAILDATTGADALVAAWGNGGVLTNPVTGTPRSDEVRALLWESDLPVLCLGTTRKEQPRHPLYLPGDTRCTPLGVSRTRVV